MKVLLKNVKTNEIEAAIIELAGKGDMPLRKDGWQFTWRKLYETEGALFYKLFTTNSPNQIEGIIMLSLLNDEMLYMNNVEVAPGNFGASGIYANVAGSLLAFGCYKSFELGKGNYLGFLAFDSKTELIELYQEKYGATLATGQKMFFTPDAGRKLIEKYLNIENV